MAESDGIKLKIRLACEPTGAVRNIGALFYFTLREYGPFKNRIQRKISMCSVIDFKHAQI